MNEMSIMHRILLACSYGPARLFRMNVGLAWTGQVIKFDKRTSVSVGPDDVVIRNARPFKAGTTGISDLLGFKTQDGVAVFVALEVKSKQGRITKEQQAFLNLVRAAGGIAGVVRSEEDALALLAK